MTGADVEKVHAPDPVVEGISRCGIGLPPGTDRRSMARAAFARERQCRRCGCAEFWSAWNAGVDAGLIAVTERTVES